MDAVRGVCASRWISPAFIGDARTTPSGLILILPRKGKSPINGRLTTLPAVAGSGRSGLSAQSASPQSLR